MSQRVVKHCRECSVSAKILHLSYLETMKLAFGLQLSMLTILFFTSCATVPRTGDHYDRGIASWYGERHHGNLTASGERFNMNQMTAAHRKLPFGTIICVRNLKTNREVTVKINDRGPFAKKRILDLSKAAADRIGMISDGEAEVEIYISACQR